MKRVLLFLIMAVGILAANCQQSNQTDGKTTNNQVLSAQYELIEVAQLKQVLSEQTDIQLFDVRTPKEFGEGSIDQAVNINFFDSDFGNQMMDAADKEQPVYIFCRSGRRSAGASEKLKDLGFKKIYDLKGGFLAWSEEN